MPDAGDESRVLLAVDGNSLVHRSFHAQASTGLRSASGQPLWAIRGLLTQLVAAVERIGPVAVLVGFDDPDRSLRRDRWPAYKAGRTEKLETLVCQLAGAVEVLRELGLAVHVPDGLEADDVLASAARFGREAGLRTVIMTSDRDAFALIDDTTRVLRIINGGVEASPLLTPERFVTMQGIRPEQYRDLAALRGDPSDNLPGVRGFGPKLAARLLAELGSVRAALDDLAAGGERVAAAVGPALAARLGEPDSVAAWRLNCQVMAMHDTLELGLDLAAGPGVLPLPADAVRAAFSAHQLTWTTATALRVLAHHDGPPPQPAPQHHRTAGRSPDGDGGSAGYLTPGQRHPGGGKRHGKLEKPRPRVDQLSLF
ncbi:MAG TPA: 5'-3' exonuclease H3TH domain-containing protein [Jatrophihabitans sp.]|nr:5'-3' exonuclease H3TH domain-containing protein [Jatrophihabitans sp.]